MTVAAVELDRTSPGVSCRLTARGSHDHQVGALAVINLVSLPSAKSRRYKARVQLADREALVESEGMEQLYNGESGGKM